MGILSRLFTRKLSEQEKEEKSRREKEWVEKCYANGEKFAEKIAIEKPILKINAFANRYPRTFFTLLFAVIIGCITLNYVLSRPSTAIMDEAENFKAISVLQQQEDPRGEILNEMMQMANNLKDLDTKIETIMAKDTLTAQDSLQLKSLLMQAEALNALLSGRQKNLSTDSVNINHKQ